MLTDIQAQTLSNLKRIDRVSSPQHGSGREGARGLEGETGKVHAKDAYTEQNFQ